MILWRRVHWFEPMAFIYSTVVPEAQTADVKMNGLLF
jgi:hypothetical protein